MTAASSRRAAFVLLTVAGAAGASGLVVQALAQGQRDRRAVRNLMRDIETRIRSHDGSAWLLTERGFLPGEAHPAVEPAHERLRTDLDRLAHVDDLRLLVQDVEIDRDTAWIDYQVEGRARPGDPPPPTTGRFTLRRTTDGWALEASRFGESLQMPGAAAAGGDPARQARPGRADTLAARLLVIAGLAASAGAALLAHPRLAALLRRTRSHSDRGE